MVGSLFMKELVVVTRLLGADPVVSSIFPEEHIVGATRLTFPEEHLVGAMRLIFPEEHIVDAMCFSNPARAAP